MREVEPAADQDARDRIRDDIHATLFVEAGAGTGKTTALVSRIVNLVLRGAPVKRIAAITFTEAAAAELKDRVRTGLEKTLAGLGPSSQEGPLCRSALDDLDAAAMQTLHAFAQRILAFYPLEAGLPPRITIADEIRAGIEFNDDWQRFMDELLRMDDEGLARAFTLGLEVKHLRAIALAFGQNLDRIALADFASHPFVLEREELLDQLNTAGEEVAARGLAHLGGPLVTHILSLQPLMEELAKAPGDDEFLSLLAGQPLSTKRRSEDNEIWGSAAAKDRAHGALTAAEQERNRLVDGARTECLMPILQRLQQFTLDRAAERRRRGVLQFDDLLVLARDLLRGNPAVRKAVAGRYDHVLIDEFQDTDPLQVEIAALLAASIDEVDRLTWDQIPVHEGRLFFVGDPKQSIYRFRRADILLYLATKAAFGETITLTANFRSRTPILERVNQIFESFIGSDPPEGQPDYIPLTGGREHADEDGPCVHLVGGPLDAAIDAVRAAEADELAALIRTIRDSWKVDDEAGGTRPAKLSDIAILLPTRATFIAIERALETAGIPFRLESRSLLYRTQEVVDLTNLLAAIDDPTDDVSVVAALRSPAFGCADDELYDYARANGYWDYTGDLPQASPGHPAPAALAELKRLHEARWRLSVSEMVERVIRERRLFEVAFANRRPRETWQRLRFVLEQARAFDQAGGATLRQFVGWLRTQADEGSRVSESVVPETDDEAVRVMTVHAAKGLEFPIVLLAGLNRDPRDDTGIALWASGANTPEVRAGTLNGGYFKTPTFDAVQTEETRLSQLEDIRLFYVAATRARDHLILSLHHKLPSRRDGAKSHAALTYALAQANGWQPLAVPPLVSADEPDPAPSVIAGDPLAERDAWLASREQLIAANTRGRALAATAVAHMAASEPDVEVSDKEEQADASQPWRRGRAGTSLGRAVHAVLQTIDLATGAGLAEAAAAQATAEGIPGRELEIVHLAQTALASEAVREAVASGRFWREIYVASEVDGTVIEGFIDLLYETPQGLVIVDYKTDSARDAAEIDAAMSRYEPQGAAYALALKQALPGRRVAKCVFVFVRPKAERAVSDLGAAMQRARQLVATAVAAAP